MHGQQKLWPQLVTTGCSIEVLTVTQMEQIDGSSSSIPPTSVSFLISTLNLSSFSESESSTYHLVSLTNLTWVSGALVLYG